MKKMEYKGFQGLSFRELLDSGECCGFKYYIFNYGTHPCCYIEIPKEHSFFGKDYNELQDIEVHGGITFSADHLNTIDETGTKWYIGWDYAHIGDYQPYYEKYELEGHKYTTEELKQDVYDLCLKLESM